MITEEGNSSDADDASGQPQHEEGEGNVPPPPERDLTKPPDCEDPQKGVQCWWKAEGRALSGRGNQTFELYCRDVEPPLHPVLRVEVSDDYITRRSRELRVTMKLHLVVASGHMVRSYGPCAVVWAATESRTGMKPPALTYTEVVVSQRWKAVSRAEVPSYISEVQRLLKDV
jgi:hypothetical protein